jgi:type IV pilus assembly protein PilB
MAGKIRVHPETLVTLQYLEADALAAVQRDCSERGTDVVTTLLREGHANLEQMYHAYARENGYHYLALEDIHPTRDVLSHIEHEVAREYKIVPVSVNDGRLHVATSNPTTALANVLDFELEYAIASDQTLASKVAEYYSAASEAASINISASGPTTDAPSLEDLIASSGAGTGDQSVAKSVQLLIMEGIQRLASDIHLEPVGKVVRVRYRVDGELRTASELTYQEDVARLVVSRIKVMSGLDSNERRRPQGGRVSFAHRAQKIDLRIAIMPVRGGEKVVMRILANDLVGKPLNELDFSDRNLTMMREALRKPHGMILVTGPTGSGKTTTLYSGISEVATDSVNVMTVEDPVEYQFDGVNQVQVKPEVGLDFAQVLRSFLRADPDIILVGEIRDRETAEIAIKASLTGHLVLSTLHTNSAALTISRLMDMGVEPYLVADSLTAALSQRLVRRLCRHCREPYTPSPVEVEQLSGKIPDTIPEVFRANPHGCRNCRRGYMGRLPVHELLPVTGKVKAAISEGKTAPQIESIARSEGKMRTLVQDGWEKIVAGLTDIDQIAALSSGSDDFSDVEATFGEAA